MRGSGSLGEPAMSRELLAMMGQQDRSCAALPPGSLDALIPVDHVARHLEAKRELSFVRELVREVSADIGRPSIDPVVFFTLQLILFFAGLRSERQLMQYDPDHDVSPCLGGERLRCRQHQHPERVRVSQAPAAACTACPRKARCPASTTGRQVKRSVAEAYVDRVRASHATAPYATAMRKREVWVEPLFAEAKDWHGWRRFRLRGLPKVSMEALLIAAGQNLKRVLSRRGWGRRPWPTGAPGLVRPSPSASFTWTL